MAEEGFGRVVTVSATYGAGGSVIAPGLADRLGVPFVDRLLSADASQQVARSQEGLAEGEEETTPPGRFLSYFARAANIGTVMAPEMIPAEPLLDEEAIRDRAEEALRPVAAGQPAVVLGRAGAVVLRSRPRTYHVRLDGPVERRVAWAAEWEHLDLDAARRRQAEADRARTQFVKRLYKADPANPCLYHLVIDSTVLGVEATIDVIVAAAERFFGRPS
jgi:cytidylate kinase